MKITTDVNFAGSRPARDAVARISTRSGAGKAESDRAFAENFSEKLKRDRAMADALAIAQSSRQIIQKAMDASSRLRSIAFQAMTTGKVNMDDLNMEIAGLREAFAGSGESVAIPVDRSSPAAQRTGEMLGGSIRKLGEYAGEMASGKPVNPELFTAVINDLKPAAEESDARINAYVSKFPGVRTMNGTADYVSLNRETAGMITGNPGAGMSAQGYLNPEPAGILTTA
ncbi:MAG TPA: hypothetical protein PK358_06275 [Spirochaetota bacterium]|nr:hypothetical protein [Spirochaetota bacterium]HPJ34422.1 hypothetical protein [Spirochaetota bacterium]